MDSASLEAVRAWFRAEARRYPWTLTEDPYAIWVSEIMLQQTVVTAAVAPFTAWMARWPDLAALAAAGDDQVLRAWEGLGYASRAKNLHRAARLLVSQGQFSLPTSYEELRALPGVGDYTASAILSFAFHQPALTLDANLKRVLQRLDAEPEWTPGLEVRWRGLWTSLVDGAASRESNQAVMQLGQRVCRGKVPLCELCPLASRCQTRIRGLGATIPRPRERQVVEKATKVLVWYRADRLVFWLARPLKGRFSHLWMVPPLPDEGVPPAQARALLSRVHTYTKYRDQLAVWSAPWSGTSDPGIPSGWEGRWVDVAGATNLGMVSVYRKVLDEAIGAAQERGR